MNSSEIIFYAGCSGMATAVLLFLTASLIHWIAGKQLLRVLERDYGKKHTD